MIYDSSKSENLSSAEMGRHSESYVVLLYTGLTRCCLVEALLASPSSYFFFFFFEAEYDHDLSDLLEVPQSHPIQALQAAVNLPSQDLLWKE